MGGGPLASIPARAGLKRSASLPPPPPARPCWSLEGALVSFCRLGRSRGSVTRLAALVSVDTRRGFSRTGLFAGGAAVFGDLGEKAGWLGIRFGPGVGLGVSAFFGCSVGSVSVTLSFLAPGKDLPSSALFASPSGTGLSAAAVGLLVMPLPSACAFLKSSRFFKMASLNSSLRSFFLGPSVRARAALPRRMLSLSSSGAT